MYQKILVIFSLLLAISFGQVVSVRYGSYPEKERIVLDFNNRVDYRVVLLEDPKRIVVDILSQGDFALRVPKGINYRLGKHPWGTRIVFERDFSSVKAFSVEDPFRIVIDLFKKMEKQEENNDDALLAILDPKVLKIIQYDAGAKEKVISERKKNVIITQRRTIVIDAGHGGHDPGAIGYMGIKEKDINLAIAKKLAEYLSQDGRFRVIMTRKDDTFLPLQERANTALKNRADLFISIHANASPQGVSHHASGTYIFAISSEAAKKKKHQIINNDSYAKLVLGTADVPISAKKVLADLAMDVTLYESVSFGEKIAKSIARELGREVQFKGIQRAGFAVLKTPGIPSVLIETGFITNPDEAVLMADKDFQDKFARAIYTAVVNYFFPMEKKLTLSQ
ncbi:N-acetylmuramoyl-L-alanine amidase [Hydrogenobacter hydrogenophilus]|uniref:N-acetylmuramoyl-L-alanine amidase n=1 Tax=Hydrogenobacter hydrogenophilus TaxID=35835 RepID=A0A285NQ75_9AQUI|nr:N-acetylmuramoyl-L-alanine amidase [Hydrogenobacter hydrogenophilus]SNZ11674.1 N-acetylmuramoyl-L-alanine amidase [Hydrogenobacter hydrogenophilus]